MGRLLQRGSMITASSNYPLHRELDLAHGTGRVRTVGRETKTVEIAAFESPSRTSCKDSGATDIDHKPVIGRHQ